MNGGKQESDREASWNRFLERISDWGDADSIVFIRDGKPVDGRPITTPPSPVPRKRKWRRMIP
jgi:hypothetical protein